MATTKAAAKKTPAAKAPAKKAPAAKAPAAKAPAAPPVRKTTALKEKMTKTQILATIAENTGLSKKQVGDVMSELELLIERSIKKRSVGEFTLPGLMKVTTVKKPARKAGKRPDPFNPGQMMEVSAKPAFLQVKVRPLKKLKEFANS